MKKKIITIAVSCALAGFVSTTYAASHAAAGKPMISTYGTIGFGLFLQDSNESWEMKNTKARLGWNVVQPSDYGKFIGQLEFDYDNASNDGDQSDGDGVATSPNPLNLKDENDGDEIDVRVARVVWKAPGDHTLVFAGRTRSGNYVDNYAHMDIFEVGGYHYFQQPEFASKLVGYKSPKFGGVHLGVSVKADNPDNDEDQDVINIRATWNSGPWQLGYSQVEANASTADDSTRETLSFIYSDGPLMVGLTHEDKLFPAGTADGDTVLGIAASYTTGDHTFRAANYSQDSDTASRDGLSATTLEYSLALNEWTNFFVNIDQFDTSATTDDDATVVGISMSW